MKSINKKLLNLLEQNLDLDPTLSLGELTQVQRRHGQEVLLQKGFKEEELENK